GAFEKLSALLRYVDGDYADERTFATMRSELGTAERPLHYLAIPPSTFPEVIQNLGKSGCGTNARIAVEKPFGHNFATARALNDTIHSVFPKSSIFRIDHFLGKEPVLNLQYFRFANAGLDSMLDRDLVDSVQITMAEDFGIKGRGKFYDETGAIRDVVQNHLLQLTAILAMDAPVGHDLESIRDEKVRLLRAIAPFEPEKVVRGQFRGYLNEKGVAPKSKVETFAAISFSIDSDRWAGVPFFIRAGKCLPVNAIEIHVQLKRPPRDLFGDLDQANEYFRFRLGPERTVLATGLR